MSLRRFPLVSGLVIGILVALFALGNLDVWLRAADAQVPFGAFRIMDGTHTQLARVNHTGQLAVDATVTVATDNVNVFHQSTVAHVSSVTHVAASGLGTPTQALSIRCVNTGATAFESCGGTVTSDTINVFHQSTVRHISSVTHIASAGLAIANQALAVRCVDTGGTTFQACGGGADPASVVQSSSWTIQAAHQVVVSHVSAVVHVASYGTLHVQGRGTAGDSHGGVLTIQGITGMNAVVVSQATASSLQMTATQTGTWTVQPGNTVNTSAWLVNAGHISSVTHVAGSVRLMSGTPNNQLAIVTHFGALAVTCYTAAGATESCGGTGGSGDAVNVFHQSTVRHVSSVTHVAGALSLVSRDGTYVTLTGTQLDVNCTGCSAASVVEVDHVSSVTHMALMSVAGTPLGLGAGLPIGHITSVVHVALASHAVIRVMGAHVTGAIHVAGLTNVGSGAPGTGTTQMVCHSTLAIHVAATAPGYTQIIHLTSSNGGINQAQWRIYICSIMVVSAHAQGFSLLEGVGTTCQGQPRHAVIGSWRPDDSVVLAANGGFSVAASFPTLSTQVPGNNLCIGQTTRTSGGSISGFMSYRAGP